MARADCELKSFLDWFEENRSRASRRLAYLGFVPIHPFDDGNGHIARAIANMALARSENSPQRLYSASAANPAGAQQVSPKGSRCC